MGQIDGFKYIKRTDPKKEDPKNKVKHFEEFIEKASDTFIENQSSRCKYKFVD